MAHRFPSTISAARISAFVSTAAWIQGASATYDADDVYLPEEALNNFIRQSQQHHVSRQQITPIAGGNMTITPVPDSVEPEKPKEDDDKSVSSISDGISSASSVSEPDKLKEGKEGEDGEDDEDDDEDAGAPVSSLPATGDPDGSSQAIGGAIDDGRASSSGLSPGGTAAIAVWVVIFVVGSAFAFWWFRRRRRRLETENGPLVDPEASRSQPMASQGAMPGILPGTLGRNNSVQSNTFGVQTNRGNNPQNDTLGNHSADGASYDYVTRQAAMPASNTWGTSDTLVPPPLPPPAAAYRPTSLEKGYYDPAYNQGYEPVDEYVQNQRRLSNESTRSHGRGVGLPSNPRPASQQSGPVISAPMMGYGLPPGRDLRPLDARTVATSDTQSTIFNWR